jgi:acetyl/propionyl-CoA carboxylase alpha subunit
VKVDLVIDGAEVKTELLGDPPACRFRFDGREFPVDVEMPEPGIYSVLLDGHSYDASVERTDRLLIVTVNGQRFEIEVRDSRRWSGGSGRAEREGHETLIAPMPGKVVRVLAAIGDAVEPGQGVIVVEAMKMQNEIKASRSGRVLTIHAREGTTVTAGEALASIG